MDPLMASLLDLLAELDGKRIPLTVGGGFGLYLKRRHLERTEERTLFEELPESRSTNDIDLFLRAEILADELRTMEVACAIERLGYTPVQEARYLQWTKPVRVGGIDQPVKLDVLLGPFEPFRERLKVKLPRVRPRTKKELRFHAHAVPEALGIDEEPVQIAVAGKRTDESAYEGVVCIPRAFPYALMKLHAFADRKDEGEKDLGRHHALDLYSIIGMMTEREYQDAVRLGQEHRGELPVARARASIRDHFDNETSLGMLRLREHQLYRDALKLDAFGQVLREVFGSPTASDTR